MHETIRRRDAGLVTDAANKLLRLNRPTENNGVITESLRYISWQPEDAFFENCAQLKEKQTVFSSPPA
ncbi:hypothetical protein [Methylococcus geothermalis]|uniref:Uncharacterized protein n=1 Tax=Methylococcus geothermalis TaxID=2681310 RepID=A0A858Q4B9_9GAMM|nr:hypothetical protein [Methylococcus geothermalis]QJD28664.1 hypothetical protein GNH96_00900 [Methylococcus geothermalis]